MTENRKVDEAIHDWLMGAGATRMTTASVDEALAASRATGQRRGWSARLVGPRPWPTSRSSHGRGNERITRVAVLALIIAALLGLMLFGALAGGQRGPAPYGLAGNGRIAYASNGDIYLGDPVSGDRTLVIGGLQDDVEPLISLDGSSMAFYRSTGSPGLEDVVVANLDGTGVRVVSPSPVRDANWLDWSPDGRALWLVSMVSGGTALQRIDLGGPPQAETVVSGVALDEPAIRPPAGAEVLYRWRTGNQIGLSAVRRDGTVRVVVPPIDSTNAEFDLRGPRWSPDGSLIAVQRWSEADQRMRVALLDAEGRLVRELESDPAAWFEGWPVWSPDGSRIALQRGYGPAGTFAPRGIPIAIVPADGQGPAVPTGPSIWGAGQRVEWSPDGRKLLFKNDDGVQLILDAKGGPFATPAWSSTSYPAWQRTVPP